MSWDERNKNMEIFFGGKTLIDAYFITRRTWVNQEIVRGKTELIEPPAAGVNGKKNGLSDVRVLYLLNNYANKAICRHEIIPFVHIFVRSLLDFPPLRFSLVLCHHFFP